MTGRGGKGKVSNDLVAVSCAAVFAVYSAGYWRTRDEAQRFETREQEGRPVRQERPAVVAAQPAALETATPTAPPAAAHIANPAPVAATANSVVAVTTQLPSRAAAAEPPPPVAASLAPLPPVAESAAIAEAATTAATPDAATVGGYWRDGTYAGWGTSRHGDIKAQVVIRNGRIVESSIVSCETRWPCDVITEIIHQPVERQSTDVDRVSRATESTNAYYYAVVAALDEALAQPSEQTRAR